MKDIQILYEDIDSSPWVDEFITRRLSRLERYISPLSSVYVSIRVQDGLFVTLLSIRDHHNYNFSANGETLYESFSLTLENAIKSLIEERRKLRDKISRKYAS